jgi:hypothetical protein
MALSVSTHMLGVVQAMSTDAVAAPAAAELPTEWCGAGNEH